MSLLPKLLISASFIKLTVQFTHYASENETVMVESAAPCHLYGDPDLYGIGVRISYYVQWGAGVLALALGASKQIATVRRGINILTTAVLINAVRSMFEGSFAVFEFQIVVSLVLALPILYCFPVPVPIPDSKLEGGLERLYSIAENPAGRFSIPPRFKKPRILVSFDFIEFKMDPVGVGCMLLLDCALFIFSPWLFLHRLDQGRRPDCTAYSYSTFKKGDLYSEDLKGWYRGYAGLSIPFAVLVGLPGLYSIYYGCYKSLFGIGIGDAEPAPLRHQGRGDGDCRQNRRLSPLRISYSPQMERLDRYARLYRRIFNVCRVLFAVSGFSVILIVEKTISANNVDMGDSNFPPGQLLPLLVAVFSSTTMFWDIWKDHRKICVFAREKREPEEVVFRSQPSHAADGISALPTPSRTARPEVHVDRLVEPRATASGARSVEDVV